MTETMTVKQAAEAAGVRPVTVRYHLRTGFITGDKSGGMWLITSEEAEKLKGLKPGPRPNTSVLITNE